MGKKYGMVLNMIMKERLIKSFKKKYPKLDINLLDFNLSYSELKMVWRL